MNKFVLYIEKHLAVNFVKILGSSLRYHLRNPKPQESVIYCFWHRDIIPLMYLHRRQNIVLLISSSKDGELVSGPAELLGYKTARGSSRRGGSAASRKLIKLSKNHNLAITPDGPKGPNKKIKDGIITLSYLTKLPIIPIAVDVKKERIFNSWDKFRLPHLFSKINVSYGDPIFVQNKDEIQEKLTEVQAAMDKLEEENKI
jgi:lysophospholipid acyltransferase (LPLAT)-like uncharacterized protein